MAIDPYSPCPGGTGKKIKFCCKDLLGELDKLDRMLQGEQYQAGLDYIESLESKFSGRACLATTKALLQNQLGKTEEAQRTVETLLDANPENPVALADLAIVAAERDAVAGIEPFHRSFAVSSEANNPRLMQALRALTIHLLQSGRLAAGLAHLDMDIRLHPDNEQLLGLFVRLCGSGDIPLPVKDLPRSLLPAPEGVPWQDEFDGAYVEAGAGIWWNAENAFASLAATAPDAPAIWYNLGMLRANLADDAGAVEALQKAVALGLDWDRAVEAESLVELLDRDHLGPMVERLALTWPVGDVDAFVARVSSDPQAVEVPTPDLEYEGPPPRSVFNLLDRPLPATGVGLADGDVPSVLAEVMLFSRETDREPRIETNIYADERQVVEDRLRELAGGNLGEPTVEPGGDVFLRTRALSWNWYLPDDTPIDVRTALTNGRRARLLVESFPTIPFDHFGGRTAQQAAADEQGRARVAGSILNLELSFFPPAEPGVFESLRQKLGLPQPQPIDPQETSVHSIPLVRYHRIQTEKLTDDDLQLVYSRAMLNHAMLAVGRIAHEVLSRQGADIAAAQLQAHLILAHLSQADRQAVQHLTAGRQLAAKTGEKTETWDLDLLRLRLLRNEADEAMQLIQSIQRLYHDRKEVMRRFLTILYEFGIVDERGRPTARPQQAGIVVPGAAASEKSKLWTPGGEAAQGAKAAIWTPGME